MKFNKRFSTLHTGYLGSAILGFALKIYTLLIKGNTSRKQNQFKQFPISYDAELELSLNMPNVYYCYKDIRNFKILSLILYA